MWAICGASAGEEASQSRRSWSGLWSVRCVGFTVLMCSDAGLGVDFVWCVGLTVLVTPALEWTLCSALCLQFSYARTPALEWTTNSSRLHVRPGSASTLSVSTSTVSSKAGGLASSCRRPVLCHRRPSQRGLLAEIRECRSIEISWVWVN